MNLFSHCVLTASDERQAESFRLLLDRRLSHGLYPREIDFRVYADPPGRVGSGGGTMYALHRLYADIGFQPGPDTGDAPSVLIIHAAGESRRLPVYAPEGKLFAPIPLPSSSIIAPVVLDAQLSLFLRFPWEPGQVVVASGDVVIDFDTEPLTRFDHPVTGFATPASFQQGSQHGVFRFDAQLTRLEDYYQKASEEYLAANAGIEGTESCGLDIGIVAMRRDYVAKFLELGDVKLQSGQTMLAALERGNLRFELYLEQLSASLATVDREEYLRRLSGRSSLPQELQQTFHDQLHDLSLGGVLARNCDFVHIGSVREYPEACARLAKSSIRPFYHLFDTAEILPDASLGRVSFNCDGAEVAESQGSTLCTENVADSYVADARGEVLLVGARGLRLSHPLPDGICIDCRAIPDGNAVAVYHAEDSFRSDFGLETIRFCGKPLSIWLEERNLMPPDVGVDNATDHVDLLELPFYIIGADSEFLSGYYSAPADVDAWSGRFRDTKRYSIRQLNELSDPIQRDQQRSDNRVAQLRKQLADGRGWRTVPAVDLAETADEALIVTLTDTLSTTTEPTLSLYRAESLRSLGVSQTVGGPTRRTLHFMNPGAWLPVRRAVKQDQIVWARAPVRLDLGGGWTDTPPYTNLFGGAVANVAVDINGQPPIQVFVRAVPEPTVTFHSIDLGDREVVSETSGLRAYADPGARFSLARAACVLLGLDTGSSLATTLDKLGGGFELSILSAIPKGSGLGTSSVLGGVILSALLRFFGFSYTHEELFLSVLELEQMLTTGGGWQDQIGGLVGGVKYIETRPGHGLRPLVHQLDPSMFEESEYHDRMTLYYTGVTRLARNILQDVVCRINRREPAYLFTHEYLRSLAQRARMAISLREYDSLSRVVAESWRANKLIHESTTNDEVEALLEATRPHWTAMKLLGAGGGGYALFFSRDRRQADDLRTALDQYSRHSDSARLVQFSLSKPGLQVTVS